MKHGNPIDEATGTETTGHVWDGITELNNPLPRWWLILLWATVAFSVVYWVLFPAIPLVEGATPGLLGYSSRGALENDLAQVAATRSELDVAIAKEPFAAIMGNPVLVDYARRSGEATFKIACAQCHGSGAQGSQTSGYPNLSDDDWLWGGTPDAIFATITHGVRNEDPDSRQSAMPAFGEGGMLTGAEIRDVAQHVLSLGGRATDPAAAARGAETFAAQCAGCHGDAGAGIREFGAPNLADAIWLYGGTAQDIAAQVTRPRMGVMPPWHARFDDATRKKLAIYVHSLGGGE